MSKHRVGSISTEIVDGDLYIDGIHLAEQDRMYILAIDVEDFLVALDGALGDRTSEVNRKDLTPNWFVEALGEFACRVVENTGRVGMPFSVALTEQLALQLGIAPGTHVKIATAGGPVIVESKGSRPPMPFDTKWYMRQQEWLANASILRRRDDDED
jgi:hypothetical protein